MLGAKSRYPFFLFTLCAALVATTACDNSTNVEDAGLLSSGPATVRILLTDAPSDYIEAAEVDIGAVVLIPAGDGEHIVLSDDGTDGFVNLLDLQDAATMSLAEAEVEAGSFAQLRLIVEAARVELADGYAFRDGTTEMDLKVPSGAQTGIKLNLHAPDGGPLAIAPGETVLVLDFDVNQSFVLRGNPETPAGIHGVIFKPTIRVTGEDVAASISGTVTTGLTGVSVAGLVVRAEPSDGGTVTGYQSQTGTAVTAADGTYTIFFLVPGTYDVSVDLEGALGTDPGSRNIALADGEAAADADFEIIDISGSISGTVSTAVQNVAVGGLTITAIDEDAGETTTTTADDGTYALEGLLPGTYLVTVEVGDDLLADPSVQEVDVGASEDVVDVDFEVIEDVSGSIAGTVSTDLTGVSVDALTVTAQSDAAGASPVTTTTASDGTYSFPSLPAGGYTISVDAGTGLTTDPATATVDLMDDEDETGVDFKVIAAS